MVRKVGLPPPRLSGIQISGGKPPFPTMRLPCTLSGGANVKLQKPPTLRASGDCHRQMFLK